MLKPTTVMEFDPSNQIHHIVVVGVGGTGSQIARSVARMIYDMRQRGLQTPHIVFVDPDRVEMKNVGRQMFTALDEGQYKAQLLARRFNQSLGLDIRFRNERFDPAWFKGGVKFGEDAMEARHTLLVGAVDNHEARKAIAQVIGATWIDSGNHFASGQVVIGNSIQPQDIWADIQSAKKRVQTKPAEGLKIRTLPNVARVFPALLEPEPEPAKPAVSCADLTLMGEQQLLINDLMATVTSQYIYKLLYRQPIKTFITYVDADGLSMRSVPITETDLAVYVPRPGKTKTA